jgi:putative peptide zinc metalloprotease protein
MAIGAAGITAEAVMAIFAVYIWHYTKPGMVNSLAFYLMAVSLVSTVLFNGNPLLKFDGYFILIDYLRIPNLQPKSYGYLKYLFMNRALGVTSISTTASSVREVAIFATYGIASFIYRFFLYFGIVAGVYYRFDKTIGVILAVTAFVLFVIRPIARGIGGLYARRSEIRPRPLAALALTALTGILIAPLAVPVSTKSQYPCYVDAVRTQKLTVPLDTFIDRTLVKQGDKVTEGSLLLRLDSTALQLSLDNKMLEKEILEEEIQILELDLKGYVEAANKRIRLKQIEHELKLLKREKLIAQEGIIAPFNAIVARLDYRVQPGFQPGKGVIVGELKCTDGCLVRTLIPEEDYSKVSEGQKVQVWFPIGTGRVFSGKFDGVKPYGEKDLKDSPFSSRLGGELATELKSADRRDAPLEPQYLCTTKLPYDSALLLGLTGRCVVASPPKSILTRLFHSLVQTLNRETIL